MLPKYKVPLLNSQTLTDDMHEEAITERDVIAVKEEM